MFGKEEALREALPQYHVEFMLIIRVLAGLSSKNIAIASSSPILDLIDFPRSIMGWKYQRVPQQSTPNYVYPNRDR